VLLSPFNPDPAVHIHAADCVDIRLCSLTDCGEKPHEWMEEATSLAGAISFHMDCFCLFCYYLCL